MVVHMIIDIAYFAGWHTSYVYKIMHDQRLIYSDGKIGQVILESSVMVANLSLLRIAGVQFARHKIRPLQLDCQQVG